MILDFNKMPDLTWTDFRGGEEDTIARMYKDSKNQIMFLKLEPGASMGVYNHENSTEIIYVLQGSATATFDGIEEELVPGMCAYCPSGHSNSVKNKGSEDLVFFSVVSRFEGT